MATDTRAPTLGPTRPVGGLPTDTYPFTQHYGRNPVPMPWAPDIEDVTQQQEWRDNALLRDSAGVPGAGRSARDVATRFRSSVLLDAGHRYLPGGYATYSEPHSFAPEPAELFRYGQSRQSEHRLSWRPRAPIISSVMSGEHFSRTGPISYQITGMRGWTRARSTWRALPTSQDEVDLSHNNPSYYNASDDVIVEPVVLRSRWRAGGLR
jgi:hypothetical protein